MNVNLFLFCVINLKLIVFFNKPSFFEINFSELIEALDLLCSSECIQGDVCPQHLLNKKQNDFEVVRLYFFGTFFLVFISIFNRFGTIIIIFAKKRLSMFSWVKKKSSYTLL